MRGVGFCLGDDLPCDPSHRLARGQHGLAQGLDQLVPPMANLAQGVAFGLARVTVEAVVVFEAKPHQVFEPIIVGPLVQVRDLTSTLFLIALEEVTQAASTPTCHQHRLDSCFRKMLPFRQCAFVSYCSTVG